MMRGKIIKKIIREKTWKAKKKTIIQILRPRCRQEDLPEYGRFTSRDIEKIILVASTNIQDLMPHIKDFDNIGNYMMEYGGMIDLAIYRALIKENVARNYAVKLIGDMLWQVRVNTKGLFPIFDPLRLQLAKITTKDQMSFLERRLKDGLKFPYGEPGYTVKFYKDGNVYCMDFYSCPVYDFYKQFGNEEMKMFRKTWCTFDYAVAEHLIEGGKYQRKHTLSDGDEVCDMRWSIDG